MIKKVALGLAVICIALGIMGSNVNAAKEMRFYIGGKAVAFTDAKPFVDESKRTMVPTRFISESLGYNVLWNAKTKEVTVKEDKKVVVLKMNSKTITVDGKKQTMDTKVVSKNGRTYVPLRFVAQAFKGQVNYDNKTNQIQIKKYIEVPVLSINTDYISQLNEKSYSVYGKGVPSSTMSYVLTDSAKRNVKGTAVADKNGEFIKNIDVSSLKDGKVTATLTQTKDGSTSEKTEKTVIKDTIAENVVNTSANEVHLNDIQRYVITGKTEPNADVIVTAKDDTGLTMPLAPREVKADKNGYYVTYINASLFKDVFTVYVKMTDSKGNINSHNFDVEKNTSVYELDELEKSRWNIKSDGTNPIETTDGFNRALQYAKSEGVKTFIVPKGTYAIKKGTDFDATAHINMVSNMAFLADDEAIFQKETNGLTGYSIMYVGPQVKNAIVKGGVYRGERDTHDYSVSSTHEWGYGVLVEGGENIVIDDIEAYNLTGDGVLIGNTIRKGTYINSSVLESGGLDENGNPTNESGRIRTVGRTQTNFDDAIYKELNSFYMWVPSGMNKNQYDVYFYDKDGKFLERKTNVNMWKGEVTIPEGADYFKAVFYADSPSSASVYRYAIDNSKNVTIKNSKMHDNRRQGITVGGGYDVLLENNDIYNIRGIAPQSGIDVEHGYGINGNVTIRNNYVHDNVYGIILYDGIGATVEGNHIKNHSYPGLVVQEEYSDALVQNNFFENSGMSVKHDATFLNNEIIKGTASFYGPNVIVDGLKGTDALVDINSREPFGVTVKNMTLVNTAEASGRLSIENQPVRLENVTLSGPSKVALLTGNVAEGSIFDNLQIVGYKIGSNLPRGTYNNCRFESDPTVTTSGNGINRNGKYVFNNCAFVTSSTALTSNNADADISVNYSTFHLNNALNYSLGIISFDSAKKVNFVSNLIDVRGKATKDVHLLRIGRSGWQSQPVNVNEAFIVGNEMYSDFAVNGIDSTLGGTESQPYTVTDNILHKVKMNTKANDIVSNNILSLE